MTASRIFVLLTALLALLAVSSCTASEGNAGPVRYTIERRIGTESQWSEIASFTLLQSRSSKAKLTALDEPRHLLTTEQRELFAESDFIYYRAVREGETDNHAAAPTAVVSPCTIIRSFYAVDKQTLLLREVVNVVPNYDLSIMGLQVVSETNSFHSGMTNGDECERSVVVGLFSDVRIQAEVALVSSVEVKPVNYEQLKVVADPKEKNERAGSSAKKKMRRRENGVWEEEQEDEEVIEPEPTFLQKYWMFLLIPIVMSFMKR